MDNQNYNEHTHEQGHYQNNNNDHFNAMNHVCNHKDCNHNGKGGGCMFCNKHSDCRQRIARMVLLIFIIIFTFWLGKELGEFRGEYKSQAYGMHGYGTYDGGQVGMMRYYIRNEDCSNQKNAIPVQTGKSGTWQQNMMGQY